MYMKKLLIILLLALAVFRISPCHAQGRFIFGVEGYSGNLWSATALAVPTAIINGTILSLQRHNDDLLDEYFEDFSDLAFAYRVNRIKVNNQKIKSDGNNYLGFKAKDLFRDIEYTLKIGWQPEQIPVGFYARIGYRHENFQTRLDETHEWTKHRLNCLRPGVCIRISPLENMIREYGVCPILDIGSNYDYYLSYKGEYGNDKSQLNNGISTFFGIGVKSEHGNSLMLTLDRQNYNLFNKDYEVDGLKPYEDVKTNRYNIRVSLNLSL